MDHINILCKIVKEHPAIEDIQLHECKGEDLDGYEMLQMIMNAGKNNLELIELSHNNINTEGGTYISDYLAKNPRLHSLYLQRNQLDDNDAIGIAEALKHNKRLRFLHLTGNNFTKIGWTALRKAEFDDSSLNSAADSNHMCVMRYPPDGRDEIEGVNISDMNGKPLTAFPSTRARQKKIYSVLSSRNRDCSNVTHFEDIPVELLPDILASIQRYSEYHVPETEEKKKYTPTQNDNHVNPLSLAYEICRYLDESLVVFEALSS